MSSRPAALGDRLSGRQEPRISWVPQYSSSAGQEAVDLARSAGLTLDPWQAWVLERSLGEMPNGLWAAFEVGLVVARQNGKGSILEARELAGLFLLDEELIIHSAHEFKTAAEAFRRLCFLIENTPELDRRVKTIHRAHGQEGIELKSGQRIQFATRTGGGGRGFTADLVIWDEAMILSEAMQGATLPTLSTVPNPQVWYTGSAVNQAVHQHGKVFTKIRNRGLAGGKGASRLLYAEWSPEEDLDALLARPELMDDPARWAEANPSLGIRIFRTYVQAERDTLTNRNFAVERLSVGDWPDLDEEQDRIITRAAWRACGETGTQIAGVPVYAVDVQPGNKSTSISAGGMNADGRPHVEVIENRPGAAWAVDRMKEIVGRHGGTVIVDPKSPTAALTKPMRDAGIYVREVSTQEYTAACGAFLQKVTEVELRYPYPQPELDQSLDAAVVRPVGDAWAWSRSKSTVDISPLVSATLALWGAINLLARPQVWSLREIAEQIKKEREQGGNNPQSTA